MAQLKEGSVIKKSTGDEVIATTKDLENIAGGGTRIITSDIEPPDLAPGDQWHREI